MRVRLDYATQETTLAVMQQLKQTQPLIFKEISRAVQVLEHADHLEAVKELYLDDMELVGNKFSIKFRVNFQFVVAGLLGEYEGSKEVLIKIMSYD
ncbi:hypothetical protein [Rheinheimera sp. MM224]|uniref:hypothetical protein n=1 Tax=Rheinheimera sp. MM224 TaxID=3019969 RepID=UPI0021F89C9C|nr:hypothetical protein [Rheinheimera sp. MM224]CAI3797682.1 hypothetical protein JAMGFMIE_01881 [Rheinheimera sp. MM224]